MELSVDIIIIVNSDHIHTHTHTHTHSHTHTHGCCCSDNTGNIQLTSGTGIALIGIKSFKGTSAIWSHGESYLGTNTMEKSMHLEWSCHTVFDELELLFSMHHFMTRTTYLKIKSLHMKCEYMYIYIYGTKLAFSVTLLLIQHLSITQ